MTTPIKKRRRRVRKRVKDSRKNTPDWEGDSAKSRPRKAGSVFWILGAFLLVVVVLGAAISNATWAGGGEEHVAAAPSADEIDVTPRRVSEDEMTSHEKRNMKFIRDSLETTKGGMVKAETVIRKFLNAKTPEDLEKWVRTPEVTLPRMRQWYATHKWNPIGVKEINPKRKMVIKGKILAVPVRLNDYSLDYIVLVSTPSGYMVDWESWVAWSSMNWEDLFSKRPTQVTEIRVVCRPVVYYNRMFTDEDQWLSIKLENLKASRVLYGYIKKDSPGLKILQGGGDVMATLRIKYPENSTGDDQVIITEVLQRGWVRSVTNP